MRQAGHRQKDVLDEAARVVGESRELDAGDEQPEDLQARTSDQLGYALRPATYERHEATAAGTCSARTLLTH
jgi:hypothetical protein